MRQSIFAAAIGLAWNDLPGLLGEDWSEFESKALVWLRLLETPGEDHARVQNDILTYLTRFPGARTKIVVAFAKIERQKTRSVAAIPQLAESSRHMIVPVFYGTNRAVSGNPDVNKYYGSARGNLSLGIVEVSIPDDHRKGALEKPVWWRLQFSENPEKHVMLLTLKTSTDRAEFVNEFRKKTSTAGDTDVLMFVHGYNVSFKDAARRAAQIATDLNFDGVPMLFSWPSEDATAKYTVDEANIHWSRTHFKAFLEMTLSELGVTSVCIVAHSMGNRALVETLATLHPAELPAGSARLRQVVFAAPDVDKDTFRDVAKSFKGRADRFTLYASSEDAALKLSKTIHKYPRAGDVRPEMLVVDTVDSIDATTVDTSLLGHSYFGDNRSVISDLFQLMRHNHPPSERGLTSFTGTGGPYWLFK